MKKSISIYHYCFLPQSETFIYRQLQGLSRHFDLKIISDSVQNREEFPDLDPRLIPPRTFWNKLLGLHNRFILKQLQGSSLFHVNFGHIAVNMQSYAKRAGIPMTAYFLGVDASSYLRNPAFCQQLKKSSFEAVFVNSEDMKKRLTPHLPQDIKCFVAYCGIPLERFPFTQRCSVPEGALFLQVSRLDEKKGIDVTLNAFSFYLKREDPKARLVIAGDGPLKNKLLGLSRSLGLEEKVSFIGPICYERYVQLLRVANVFLHPSVTADDGDMEGIPTAICEAMASGLPVVSTRHSGIPELIDTGVNGFLAEERDIDGLLRQMVQLRKADVGSISQNARAKIEVRFDHTKTIRILSEHMDQIITGGVRGV